MILNLGRYLLIVVLIIFVYRVIKLIDRDLKASHSDSLSTKGPSTANPRGREQSTRNPVELVLLEGENNIFKVGESLQLRSKMTIGRGQENNLVLQSTTISKRHTRIWEASGQWWVEDSGSKNGTYVNEILVTKPVALANSDKIRLGNFVFQFVRWNNEVQ